MTFNLCCNLSATLMIHQPAGVLLEKPFKLVAMHIQGGGQLDSSFSLAVSVKHIEFV